jgi:alpha-beta hydrolase superfamily lysophospholipase
MDLNNDFTSMDIELLPDYEGEVKAVLTASNYNTNKRKSVLYLHGYIDYFFHPHVAEKFNANGFDFYALDLRKYGRALLPHQHPNYCKSIEEYFEEISITLEKISKFNLPIYLLAHSTGGLIASVYMNNGRKKELVKALILNSPFLDFNLSKVTKSLSIGCAKLISKFSNYAKLEGALSSAYAKSIHKKYYGKWDFNLDWKPIDGFPTYFQWVLAIAEGQKKIKDFNIKVPILIMHSDASLKTSKFTNEAMYKDIVLNIDDIKRVGIQLGDHVSLLKINKAQHDIFLSAKKN